MASQLTENAWLEWMASLMGAGPRQTETAALPPQEFYCLLEELPLHLIPRRLGEGWRRNREVEGPLFLNPRCTILRRGQVPVELEGQRGLLDNFSLEGTVAWVRDAASGGLQPFWLSTRLEEMLSGGGAGEAVPEAFPDDARALLARAGILVAADHGERRLAEWAEIAKRACGEFHTNGYAPLGGLIHPFHLAALRRYYRQAIRRGAIAFGDEQCARRYGAHNESVARFFHHQIAGAVGAAVGEAVKPSYVYLGSYVGGAELKKHIDREQCEFSVTLCLDFSPEPELATSWPVRLDTREGAVTVYQALGDGLLYRGPKVPHYRDVLAEGCASTSMFLHYVSADFAGALE
jgi:hypothetical protein